MEQKYYMVRAINSSEESFKVFLGNSVVALGWSAVDFCKYDDDHDLFKAIEKTYYDTPETRPVPTSLGKKRAAIQRFRQIKEGDRILVPYNNQVLLAVATGEHFYNASSFNAGLANQQKVDYLRDGDGKPIKILRSDLLEKIQRRLRMPGAAVLDLTEFREDLKSLFDGEIKGYDAKYSDIIDKKTSAFKKNLLDRIMSGDTFLQGGGLGLEKLVQELLICEGFDTARILSKTTFGCDLADVDILATKTDVFLGDQQYLFQVKHHAGVSDETGIHQLIEAKKSGKLENTEENNINYYVLITTGRLSEAAQEQAEHEDIKYMEGEKLSDWIYSNCHKLSPSTRSMLKISTVPELIGRKEYENF